MPRRIGAVVTIAAVVVLAVLLLTGDRPSGDRGDALAARLRCPVCQSESVADSTSETARNMRTLIDEQIAAGSSDEDIIDFFEARYGEWIVLDAPASGRTLVLWLLPLGAAIVGGSVIATRRRRGAGAADPEAIAEDQADLERQVALGEIDEETATSLAATYAAELPQQRATPATTLSSKRALAGAAVLAVGVGVTVFAVVNATDERAEGELLTGGIAADEPRDLSSVSNEELEAVVAANPDVVPMRLALARRYFNDGDFSAALPHYLHVLETEQHPEALANVGWMAYLNGESETAAGYLERSLQAAPNYTQAQWFLANVRFFGESDMAAAEPLLRAVVEAEDVPNTIRDEAEAMLAEATS